MATFSISPAPLQATPRTTDFISRKTAGPESSSMYRGWTWSSWHPRPRGRSIVWPLLLVLQALPVFAIAPLLVLWFGFGLASKVVMASLVIFFPVASSFADALRRTSQDLLDAAALTQATPLATLFLIRVPSALPGLGSGLRVAAVFAPIGAVIGEWVGASRGLGFVMLQANARMQADTLFAALIILAVLTIVLRFLVDAFAARLTPWVQAS